MAFVSSYTTNLGVGTVTIPVPSVVDVSGNNNSNGMFSHMYLVSSSASGTVAATFDTRSTISVQVIGLSGVAAAVPCNAKSIQVVIGVAVGYVHFGKMC